MSYNQQLANRVRKKLGDLPRIEEKEMMGGLVFMYKEKMCAGVFGDELMCRIDRAFHDTAIAKEGCRTMSMAGRSMLGYVLVAKEAINSAAAFNYWVQLCLDYNSQAKASKKKKA